ncbi:MAG: hypothetical protein KHX31_09530 [Akkermansia sp.]|uniref:hypothetical protein n=1 Tax=Akkermansia sp. TaxID=1872421 RepID=UPI0025C06CBA|nr:hypothetical protein [Akkermansia sp.]MBS5508865.1 hypothetical protein [Akkermansia sp.]MCD8063172.1 hypothetical protein [Akkermansia sp.]
MAFFLIVPCYFWQELFMAESAGKGNGAADAFYGQECPGFPVLFQYRRMDHAEMPVQRWRGIMNKGARFSLAAGRYFMRYRGRLHKETVLQGDDGIAGTARI